MIFDRAKCIFPECNRIIELVPEDRIGLEKFFEKCGFSKSNEIVPKFSWLPENVKWNLYFLELK